MATLQLVLTLTAFGCLFVWTGLLVQGFRKGSYSAFFWFGVAFMLFLNTGYFIHGIPESIRVFIGLFDPLMNLALDVNNTPGAMTCPGNSCSSWGDVFDYHSSWAVVFYQRFEHGAPELRLSFLKGHVAFNSVSFALTHWQLLNPGNGKQRTLHRIVGRINFASITAGVLCATMMASEHGSVKEYGGDLSKYGFYSMAGCVYVCAVLSAVKAWNREIEAHRRWAYRFAGSLWGAFFLFRVALFVLDPLLRNFAPVAWLLCVWGSAPMGALIADKIRRHLDRAGLKQS